MSVGLGIFSPVSLAEIKIEQAWARANPPVVNNSAAYMTLVNDGQEEDRLLGVGGAIAERVELHAHLMENGMMAMRPVAAIEVTPGTPTVLEPGGLHIMLIGLKQPLKPGQTFPLTLDFHKAGQVEVTVTVRGHKQSGGQHKALSHH